MRPSLLALTVVALCVAGCSSHEHAPAHGHAPTTTAPPPDTHADPATPAATGVGATAGEGNGVVIRGAPTEGAVAISVAVTGDTPVSLDPHLGVQRKDGDAWTDVQSVSGLALRSDCHQPPATCLHLVPGAELLPPAWLGTIGDAQCACEHCVPAPAGTYRFVAKTCDGTRYYAGEPFAFAAL